ncbi:TetR/AcrR family transcriptional regulator [Stenotrophomonas sp. S48]|uniref:TetR/AcrR family transcriptional regulator n=1 Tax=unclassified Stenotrophomonas TaxID=196198 RepID=UPI001901A0E2|nr:MULTISPECIES: TetR/AcrR family transcriptional regulator [unclassified Stenotrophomonas]MBK0025193.1 TetR/AcrR family transcriptional regulator [Stenotrophomonas sp. S48]MBK0048316.1 TetR/AcrR family transcriptional regulator [Stenotrophomonas sp. S49]
MAQRGRPRRFDRDVALQAMMKVFWARGYEGAQLVDLTTAAGIAPPSFYAAFGSKEAAFCEAVDHYIATVGAKPRQALDNSVTLRDGVEGMLRASIEVALSARPGGCLLILGVVNCLPGNEAARAHLKAARDKTRELIRSRLERARTDGELPFGFDTSQCAAFLHGVTQMISFHARDGANRAELEALIAPALRALCFNVEG